MFFGERQLAATTDRLNRVATQLAQGSLPWILSQVMPRLRQRNVAGDRGYARAWARLGILEMVTPERLGGFGEREVVALAVERAVDKVLRAIPHGTRPVLRKAA